MQFSLYKTANMMIHSTFVMYPVPATLLNSSLEVRQNLIHNGCALV